MSVSIGALRLWSVGVFAALAFVVLGARAQEESSDTCSDACDSAETVCLRDCDEANDFDACEAACVEEADTCYEECG
jgi:hypothetical protein